MLYRRLPDTGAAERKQPVVFYDLEEREEKTILDDADVFELTADGKKVLARKKGDLRDRRGQAGPEDGQEAADRRARDAVDPVAEWRQIFNDAWRFERDFFYDPSMHGVDWTAMRERYGKLLDDCVTRWDVNFVLGELIAELNASHTYRGGGDTEKRPERGVGLLGRRLRARGRRLPHREILDGAPWDSEARSPLPSPGVNVKEGDYLLAVNGVPLDTDDDPWAAFAGPGGQDRAAHGQRQADAWRARARSSSRRSRTRTACATWPGSRRTAKRVEEAIGRPGRLRLRARHRASTARPSWCASSAASSTRTA